MHSRSVTAGGDCHLDIAVGTVGTASFMVHTVFLSVRRHRSRVGPGMGLAAEALLEPRTYGVSRAMDVCLPEAPE